MPRIPASKVTPMKKPVKKVSKSAAVAATKKSVGKSGLMNSAVVTKPTSTKPKVVVAKKGVAKKAVAKKTVAKKATGVVKKAKKFDPNTYDPNDTAYQKKQDAFFKKLFKQDQKRKEVQIRTW